MFECGIILTLFLTCHKNTRNRKLARGQIPSLLDISQEDEISSEEGTLDGSMEIGNHTLLVQKILNMSPKKLKFVSKIYFGDIF